MALNLIDSFGKKGVSYNLLTRHVDIEDITYLSKYFIVSDLPATFEGGKNSVSINGSNLLKKDSEVLVECHDSAGNLLYIEMAKATNRLAYKEATSYIISIHVYNDNSNGTGKLILYGTTATNKSVRWISNITIDKTKRNTSKVRFYTTPTIEVTSIQIPVLSDTTLTKRDINFTGSFYGLAVNPAKDVSNTTVNRRTVDIDYRINIRDVAANAADTVAINSQMAGNTVNAYLYEIQAPFSNTGIVPRIQTASFIIKEVINNSTFKITDPYFYTDGEAHYNEIITNINQGTCSIDYPYIGYSSAASTYLTTSIGGTSYTIRQSYADITYGNIKTFSGFVARHKLYKRSMLQNADYVIVADEPIFINELLLDNITKNKYYEKMGVLQKDSQITKYWFTSSTNISLVHSPEVLIDSMKIQPTNYSAADGNSYVIVKNDSVDSNRNAIYLPFSETQFLASSGSKYDSNFIELKKDVEYILSSNSVLEKDIGTEAWVDFYFTSSTLGAEKETTFTPNYGIKIGRLLSGAKDKTLKRFDNELFFFTPSNHLYGTLVIVPYQCKVSLQNISFRVYGDDGFSPDAFTTRVPWPISIADETFQIKAELFDINSNLVYSNLYTVQNFDPTGSSLIPYIPGGIDLASLTFVSGSLTVSQSLTVQKLNLTMLKGDIVLTLGDIYIPSLSSCAGDITQSRYVKWGDDTAGALCRSGLIDVDHDDAHIRITLETTATPAPGDAVDMRQSIATLYNASRGRKIYWVSGVKFIESGSITD